MLLHKKCKLRSKGAWPGSCKILLKFWEPVNISETAKAINLKSGVPLAHNEYNSKKCKSRSKESVTSRNLFLKFWDPSISLKQL